MDLPKYAAFEHERRFLVDPACAPCLDGLDFRRIEDRYLDGTRLRLRAVTDSATGEQIFKFCKKYGSDDPISGPVTNLYLEAAEHAALAVLPAALIVKRRYAVDAVGLDVFEGELSGLMLCEAEAPSREAALSLAFPAWVGREVTGDPFFRGGSLCRIRAEDLQAKLSWRA
jgi:CYTH domain-containing protein